MPQPGPQPQGGQQPQEQPLAPAVIEEAFTADTVNVLAQESQPGMPPRLSLRFLVGQTGPGTFLAAKIAHLAPDLAVQLGEHLAREGQRLRSGVVIPSTGVPRDLKG